MPTVVDSLIVTLGLDPKNFTKGQKEAAASFAKTKAQMRSDAADIEDSAKKMRDALGKATTGVFDLMAAFLGGRGLKEFVQDAVRTNNALGILSTSLGSSPQLLSAWGIAVQRMGGNAAATQASLQGLSDALVDLRTQGKNLPNELFLLEAKSGKNIDFQHGWERMAIDLANAASTLAKTDPTAANRFLRAVGLDPTTAALLIRQGPHMAAYLNTMKKLAPSDGDIAASERMTDAQGKLRAEYDQLATKIMTALSPALIALADKLGVVVEAMSKWVEANPGLTEAITGFLALLAGAKILTAIKNILSLRSALLGLAAANEGSLAGGILGFLAANPWIAGLIAGGAVMSPGDLNSGESERQRRANLGSDPDYYRPGHPGGPGGADEHGGHGVPMESGTPPPATGPVGPPGTYRPKYNLSAADLSDSVIAKINGEATSSQASTDAVINNMFNRLGTKTYGPSGNLTQVAFAPGQYAGYRRASAARAEYIRSRIRAIAAGSVPDNTGGANEYRASSYYGPWYRHHANAPVVGGNRFAYNPKGGRGPYAAYDHPGAGTPLDDYKAHRGGNVPMPANMPVWKGQPVGSVGDVSGGAAHAAALSNIANDNRATTTSSSNEMHINGGIHVNAPHVTDAHGVATHIDSALADSMFANFANYGPN